MQHVASSMVFKKLTSNRDPPVVRSCCIWNRLKDDMMSNVKYKFKIDKPFVK